MVARDFRRPARRPAPPRRGLVRFVTRRAEPPALHQPHPVDHSPGRLGLQFDRLEVVYRLPQVLAVTRSRPLRHTEGWVRGRPQARLILGGRAGVRVSA
jgi:hypothetical protein